MSEDGGNAARPGFERHARTVTGLTLVSRFGGLARDAVMARVFGIGAVMDAFALGFSPDPEAENVHELLSRFGFLADEQPSWLDDLDSARQEAAERSNRAPVGPTWGKRRPFVVLRAYRTADDHIRLAAAPLSDRCRSEWFEGRGRGGASN